MTIEKDELTVVETTMKPGGADEDIFLSHCLDRLVGGPWILLRAVEIDEENHRMQTRTIFSAGTSPNSVGKILVEVGESLQKKIQ